MFFDEAFRDWARYNPPHGNARAGAPATSTIRYILQYINIYSEYMA